MHATKEMKIRPHRNCCLPVLLLMLITLRAFSQDVCGTMIIAYASGDSIVIGADSKITIHFKDRRRLTTNHCKISKIDNNVYFAAQGLLMGSDFSQLEIAMNSYRDTVGIQNQVDIFANRLIEPLRDYLRARKEAYKDSFHVETIGAFFCTFIDDKPAVFKVRLVPVDTLFNSDSIYIERESFIAARQPRKLHISNLGGTRLSKTLVESRFLPYTGVFCGIRSLIAAETLLDPDRIGLPISILVIKRDTTYWAEKGECGK